MEIIISEKIYLPIIYIIIALIVYVVLIKIINKLLIINKLGKKKSALQQKRETTVVNLIKNIIKYVVAVILILSILSVYGVETTSIIASLGIAGAIIGLAFQDTIKNLLSGISIIFDNHYMQGDIITVNNFKGEVIELGLQTTKIKAYTGEVMIIDNSLITSVINHSMFNTKLILEIPVIKDVSIEKFEKIIGNVKLKIEQLDEVKGELTLLGIERLNGNNYIYKVEVDCKPNNHYSVNRKFMALLKEQYDKENIKVPGDDLIIDNLNSKK